LRPGPGGIGRGCVGLVVFLALGLALGGCGSLARSLRAANDPFPPPSAAASAATAPGEWSTGGDAALSESIVEEGLAAPSGWFTGEGAALSEPPPGDCLGTRGSFQCAPSAEDPPADVASAAPPGEDIGTRLAQAPVSVAPPDAEEIEQYDPFERFNEKVFEFNLRVDRYVLKPAANVYRKIMPEPFQLMIGNGFDNIKWVPRFINNLLQAKWNGAGRELARFLINSTAGIGGLFDPAKDYWGIRSSREDFGQTLGVWGSGPGPYLVLPFMEPMTVRDGIGRGVDTFLDPLSYVLPLFWDRVGMKLGEILNERALYYELFEGVQETSVDLYSSVRHFYLQRREKQIRE
jgi:phospholipid-binding lipoprotein MlaA